jgi:hypothetical protein
MDGRKTFSQLTRLEPLVIAAAWGNEAEKNFNQMTEFSKLTEFLKNKTDMGMS